LQGAQHLLAWHGKLRLEKGEVFISLIVPLQPQSKVDVDQQIAAGVPN
jgi:hypothetical protein